MRFINAGVIIIILAHSQMDFKALVWLMFLTFPRKLNEGQPPGILFLILCNHLCGYVKGLHQTSKTRWIDTRREEGGFLIASHLSSWKFLVSYITISNSFYSENKAIWILKQSHILFDCDGKKFLFEKSSIEKKNQYTMHKQTEIMVMD